MKEQLEYYKFCNKKKLCVIIPTYNNCFTIASVVESVLNYSENIIVVNDGCTDNTAEILKTYDKIIVINIKRNKGKGYAIRIGFKEAIKLEYDYAITIDADGQHYADDIPKFLTELEKQPESIIIGNRNMEQDGIPKKSSFGKRFSNFWFWVNTGNKIPDTQSGYRLYPLFLFKKVKFFTRKYEFEIEVLVRLAWKGIKITSIPIQVKYFSPEERVSHFRPFKDFGRISILNTVLVTYALIFIHPFWFIKKLNKKNIKQFIDTNILKSKDSNTKITFSVMLGVFMGSSPFWGWQMTIVFFLSILFKLNKVIALVASNISLPPMLPFIIYGSYKIGGFVYTKNVVEINFNSSISLEMVKTNFLQYFYGSLIFAFFLSLTIGVITFIVLKIWRKKPINDLKF